MILPGIKVISASTISEPSFKGRVQETIEFNPLIVIEGGFGVAGI